MNYRKGKLTKISTLEGIDYAYLNEGATREGLVLFEPKVGNRCMVHTLSTSPVKEIVIETKNKVRFKTMNSLYELVYED